MSDADRIPAETAEVLKASSVQKNGLRRFNPAGYPNGWLAGFFCGNNCRERAAGQRGNTATKVA
jgi:hypothetical protein